MPKPSYRRSFLKQLRPLWAERLSDWKPGLTEPVWWAEADSSFHRSICHTGRDLLAHLSVAFTPKWPAAFTADVFITPAGESLPLQPPPRWDDDVADLLPGQYRIGWFGRGQDFWWHLIDEAATTYGSRMAPASGHWYAPDYANFTDVVDQAAEDFTLCVEREVIPKLHRWQ